VKARIPKTNNTNNTLVKQKKIKQLYPKNKLKFDERQKMLDEKIEQLGDGMGCPENVIMP
jgi:hypothetical protein